MKKIFTLTLFFFGITTALYAAEPRAFQEGNDFYKEAQVDRALESYVSANDSGWESSALYFNIGNCYFKKKEWGRAVLNYEKAGRLSPRDPDIAFNERLALTRAGTPRIQESYSVPQRLSRRLFRWITIDEATLGLVVLYLLGLALIALSFSSAKKPAPSRYMIFAFILLFIICGIAVLYDRIVNLGRAGVIVAKTAAAKFEPSPDATTYFEVAEGMLITTIEEQKDWIKIKRSDGKTGWIPRQAREIIS